MITVYISGESVSHLKGRPGSESNSAVRIDNGSMFIYSDNRGEEYEFKNVRQAVSNGAYMDGVYAECESIPDYLSQVIKPVEKQTNK